MTWFLCAAHTAAVAGAIIAAEVFAQKSDALSGGAGWVGAGLLGAVLSWLLLVHLPSKDKQVKELLEGKDKQAAEIIAAFRQESKELRGEFREALSVIEAHSDRRITELSLALRAEFERLNDALVQQTGRRT